MSTQTQTSFNITNTIQYKNLRVRIVKTSGALYEGEVCRVNSDGLMLRMLVIFDRNGNFRDQVGESVIRIKISCTKCMASFLARFEIA